MKVASIRQALHSYLEVADDKIIKALYTLLKERMNESSVEYIPELRNELDVRRAHTTKGSAKMVTAAQSKKRIQQLLKAGRSK